MKTLLLITLTAISFASYGGSCMSVDIGGGVSYYECDDGGPSGIAQRVDEDITYYSGDIEGYSIKDGNIKHYDLEDTRQDRDDSRADSVPDTDYFTRWD